MFFHFSIKKDDHTLKPCRQDSTWSSEHTRLQFDIAFFNHYFDLLESFSLLSQWKEYYAQRWIRKNSIYEFICTNKITVLDFPRS